MPGASGSGIKITLLLPKCTPLDAWLAWNLQARAYKRYLVKLELREYKKDFIKSKIIPILRLPRFFTTYKVREKARQFQNWNYF